MTDPFEIYVALLRKYHCLVKLNLDQAEAAEELKQQMLEARSLLTKKQLDMIEDLQAGGIPII